VQATRKLLQEGQAASGAASLQGHPFQPDSSSSPTEASPHDLPPPSINPHCLRPMPSVRLTMALSDSMFERVCSSGAPFSCADWRIMWRDLAASAKV
jgi:hypothetical protein